MHLLFVPVKEISISFDRDGLEMTRHVLHERFLAMCEAVTNGETAEDRSDRLEWSDPQLRDQFSGIEENHASNFLINQALSVLKAPDQSESSSHSAFLKYFS